MLVKVCGIKDIYTGSRCIELGADALGFVFASSTREISLEKAKEIIESLNGDVLKIGVFVNSPLDTVNKYVKTLGLDIVQLHGEEDHTYCENIEARVIKAISIREKCDVEKVYNYKNLYGYLFDRKGEKYVGGEGKTFNWNFLDGLEDSIKERLILAGGLNTNNVKEAIEKVNPFMVDVSSGVEKNGVKDETLIKDFLSKVKQI